MVCRQPRNDSRHFCWATAHRIRRAEERVIARLAALPVKRPPVRSDPATLMLLQRMRHAAIAAAAALPPAELLPPAFTPALQVAA